MRKKVVFLDIDGTLADFDGVIPESTKTAIRKARANGHHMVICTGRSLFQILPEVINIGFDGIVGGSGAFAVCGGHEIFHHYMMEDKRRFLSEYLEENKFIYMVQTDMGAVTNIRCINALSCVFESIGFSKDREEELFGKLVVREDVWNCENIEKLVYHNAPFTLERVKRDLSSDFYVTALSFNEAPDCSGEIGIGGINKATGMNAYLKYIGCGREDSIAIGDGANDIEMILYADTGIAMGNAVLELKECADFVTKPVKEDGIYCAFERIKLI